MAIRKEALEYCKRKGLFTMSESEKESLCKKAFLELEKIPNNYKKNKELLSKLRGE
jgi:hypothetical protein